MADLDNKLDNVAQCSFRIRGGIMAEDYVSGNASTIISLIVQRGKSHPPLEDDGIYTARYIKERMRKLLRSKDEIERDKKMGNKYGR